MTDKESSLFTEAQELYKEIQKENELREKYKKLPSVSTKKWYKVGEVGVDAGIVWIGDPCYVLALPHIDPATKPKDCKWPDMYEPKELPSTLGRSWQEFCDKLSDNEYESPLKFYERHVKLGHKSLQMSTQFNYETGHPGLGVCVGSGHGDGLYDVFVRYNKEGRIAEAKVVFIEEPVRKKKKQKKKK